MGDETDVPNGGETNPTSGTSSPERLIELAKSVGISVDGGRSASGTKGGAALLITLTVIGSLTTLLTTLGAAWIGKSQVKQTAEAASAQVANQTALLGEVRAFATETPPSDEWMECAGQSLSKKEYKPLWDVIDKNWGAVDAEHFNLPDLRGVSLRGWNDGKNVNWDDTPAAAKEIGWWDSGVEKRFVCGETVYLATVSAAFKWMVSDPTLTMSPTVWASTATPVPSKNLRPILAGPTERPI